MPARLTVHFPSLPARVLALPDGRETVVGRDLGCDVVLDDDRVSRRHARFSPGSSGWTLSDLDSKNGTLADGMPLGPGALRDRCWISFGGLIASFEILPPGVAGLDDERLRRFTTSFDLQRGLPAGAGLAELLPRVVASMLQLANAERGFLLLASPEGELEVVARSGLSWEDLRAEDFGGSVGAVQRALAAEAPVVTSDVRSDAELGERASVVAAGIRALLCVPVRALDRLIGVLYADSRKPGAAFTDLDIEIVEALAAQAGLAIAVARLNEELVDLSRRIGETSGADPALRRLLAAEISAVLDRSLCVARPGAWRPERWPRPLSLPEPSFEAEP